MIGDPRICCAMRKWRPSKWTIRWRWSREKRSSHCARSGTIRWRGCTRIARSTRRSTRAGGAFQDDWEKAERGPQAVDPTREYVDGGRAREPITERQRKAVLRLNRAERELGADGSALVHEVLILGMTMEQIGQRRGLRGQRWIDYFARRFRECLDRLALIYGFATDRR
jgi:hypothetical protein